MTDSTDTQTKNLDYIGRIQMSDIMLKRSWTRVLELTSDGFQYIWHFDGSTWTGEPNLTVAPVEAINYFLTKNNPRPRTDGHGDGDYDE